MTGHVVLAVLTAAMLAWLPVHRRRYARWLERQVRREAGKRAVESVAALEAEWEDAPQLQAGDVIALAEYFCRFAAHEQGLSLFAEVAEQYPMPQRPAPPAAAPGEPWQLRNPSTDAPDLVEPGVPENNPGGEIA